MSCHEKSGLLRSCISPLVSQQAECMNQKCVISAIQTKLIGSGKRGDFYRLNFGADTGRKNNDAAQWD